MKKLIAGLLTAALMTLGLVAATAGASNANYVHHRTKCSISGTTTTRAGRSAHESVGVTKGAKGTLTITITGPNGFHRTVHKSSFWLGHLKPGVYRVVAHFSGKSGWGNSTKAEEINVRK